jgi:hypothetical protein
MQRELAILPAQQRLRSGRQAAHLGRRELHRGVGANTRDKPLHFHAACLQAIGLRSRRRQIREHLLQFEDGTNGFRFVQDLPDHRQVARADFALGRD